MFFKLFAKLGEEIPVLHSEAELESAYNISVLREYQRLRAEHQIIFGKLPHVRPKVSVMVDPKGIRHFTYFFDLMT